MAARSDISSAALAAVLTLSVACAQAGPEPRPAELGDEAQPAAPIQKFADQSAGSPGVGAAALRVQEAGSLKISDGRLAVADALVNDQPLVVADLPAGEHRVHVLVATTPADARIAAARIVLSGDTVVRWKTAGSIPVDSGNGAFFNPRLTAGLGVLDGTRLTADLLAGLKASYRPTYSTAVVSSGDAKMVAFSTGFGDGAYPVYVGLSAAGGRVMVLIDCEILPWPATPASVGAKPSY